MFTRPKGKEGRDELGRGNKNIMCLGCSRSRKTQKKNHGKSTTRLPPSRQEENNRTGFSLSLSRPSRDRCISSRPATSKRRIKNCSWYKPPLVSFSENIFAYSRLPCAKLRIISALSRVASGTGVHARARERKKDTCRKRKIDQRAGACSVPL